MCVNLARVNSQLTGAPPEQTGETWVIQLIEPSLKWSKMLVQPTVE